MNEREILDKIRRSAEQSTPDRFDSILAECGEQNRSVIRMKETKDVRENIRNEAGNEVRAEAAVSQARKKRKAPWIGGIVAACLLLAVGVGGYNQLFAVASVVGIDVNPSVALSVSKNEKVRDAQALNGDGEKILDDMDLEGVDLDVAVNALVGSMVKNGYVDEIRNSVLVSVEGKDGARNAALQQEVSAEIEEILRGFGVSGAVLGQTIDRGMQGELQAKANEYDISVGKAALIQKIINRDVSKSFESLAGASVSELTLLAETKEADVVQTGTASRDGYIGEAAAKAAAFKDAGVAENAAGHVRVQLDYDDGRVQYEVEFISGLTEYDYDIDAVSGAILKRDIDRADDLPMIGGNGAGAGSETAPGNGTAGTPANLIGEDEAKRIALDHCGLDAADAQFLKLKLDRDDGVYRYEMEFLTSDREYEYEIDAVSGRITDYDCEHRGADDDYTLDYYKHHEETHYSGYESGHHGGAAAAGSSAGGAASGGASAGYIGEAAAKQIALSDAGVADPGYVGVEFDDDDGVAEYSVEFMSGGVEYEYEIDAVSGSILKREAERD